TAADLGPPARRSRDPRQDLQQRRLAGTVRPDDPEHLALTRLEGDVPYGPDLSRRIVKVTRSHLPDTIDDAVAQRPVRRTELADPVLLRETFGFDRDRHQMLSANRGSERRK